MVFDKVLTKVFGTANERLIKKLWPVVAQIGELEAGIKQLSDEQLRAKTVEFRARIASSLEGITGEEEIKNAESAALDEILPEAFAVVREAGWRAVQMRHFDVQLIGGMVLHQGKIAEMRTGEGKTLVATLACYLNALAGKGVHVVTVNDYLAKRDAEWMGKIYEFLGLTVGVIVHDLDDSERRAAYAADITYGTNNEFGFDYLRDNMKFELKDCVQRGHYYAIVDEVDSILIDEARTPLIISGPTEQTTDKYARARAIIPKLVKGEEVEWSDHKRQQELGIQLNEGRSFSAATTSSMRSSARSASPMKAGRRSRICSGSATSPTRRTGNSSTTSKRPSRPTRSTSATWSTWSRTAKSSSSTRSPGA